MDTDIQQESETLGYEFGYHVFDQLIHIYVKTDTKIIKEHIIHAISTSKEELGLSITDKELQKLQKGRHVW